MNQPFTVPLFLPRKASDHSQLSRWRTVRARSWSDRWRRSDRSPDAVVAPVHTVRDAGPIADPTPGIPAAGPSHGTLDRTDVDARDGSGDRRARSRAVWAVVITGMALFMASLDNLVVSTALPVIREHLHAGLSGLEWTVNAYTLTFAVLLLSAAAMASSSWASPSSPPPRRSPPWPRASRC
jgi:hypothetical protein